MALLIVSFVAGVLTVLAPCVLPLLPVVIGSSATNRSKSTPYIVVGSLALSIILFTYLLKASTAFIMVPQVFWTYLSGGILTLFGITLLFPVLWEKLPGVAKLSAGSNKLVGSGYKKKSFWGDILIGVALGPVFSTCSPTYFVILATVLPVSFFLGTAYILSYVLGLSIFLLLIALLGQRFAGKLSKVSDSRGYLKKGIGLLFIVLGLLIATGYEKKLETAILDSGYFDVTKLEHKLLKSTEKSEEDVKEADEEVSYEQYKEIVDPAGFVNTEGITLGELIGEKVILVDFMTYSCINCQRTFPYLNAWYEEYKDQGLEIVGIHTPEFAFEKDINNVRNAMEEFGIKHPVVLDNDYATWRNYGNNYWPRKYLIDIEGNIVYDHIGEGAYEKTEMKIRELLEERAIKLGNDGLGGDTELAASAITNNKSLAGSPETYFGSRRNEHLANGVPGATGVQSLVTPEDPIGNALYLGGTWDIQEEYAESSSESTVIYHYQAKEVYIVGSAATPIEVEIWQDGELVGDARGSDVNEAGIVTIQESKLYKLIKNEEPGEHILELRVKGEGLQFYAFTFG